MENAYKYIITITPPRGEEYEYGRSETKARAKAIVKRLEARSPYNCYKIIPILFAKHSHTSKQVIDGEELEVEVYTM